MLWLNFVTLSPALWLSCLSSGHASALPRDSIVNRQAPPEQDRYVYRGDGRAPSEIRDTGGFRPQGDDWQDHDESFDLNRHYKAGPGGYALDEWRPEGYVFRTAYVSVALQRPTAEGYGYWLYEMRRMPSILDNGDNEGEVMALGGIPWRAVRRYVQMRGRPGDSNRVGDSMWMNNPDYDEALYETGPNARYCHVSDDFPSALNARADQPMSEGSDSDSKSIDSNESWEDEPSTSNASRRRFNAADIYMDRTPGAFELYGPFPPVWTQYPPNNDVPGPDAALLPALMDEKEGSGEPPAKKPKVEETAGPLTKPVPASIAPKYVFYGDYLWPAEAKRQGGFLTPADSLATIRNPPITAYTLNTHLNRDKLKLHPESYFVAAHHTFGAAAKEAVAKAAKFGGQFDPVVYLVHATPHMFKVGNELAVPGGMVWQQVRGWTQVPRDYTLPEKTPTRKQELHKHFEEAYREKPNIVFQKSPDYDPKFDQYTVTANEQPQLQGSRQASRKLINFMKEQGLAVGFRDKFPLFAAPKVITGESSAAAKTVEPAPHEAEGVLEKVWDFMKEHPVAIALLPAVAALNLVPGVGEVADAFEFAALSTEAVEGAGLALEGTATLAEGAVITTEEGTVAVEEGATTVEDVATVEQPDEEVELPDVPTDEIEEDLHLPDVPTVPIQAPETVPADKVALQAD